MSANLNKEHYTMYGETYAATFNHLPKQPSREICRIVVSPENAAELGIEDVLHLHSAVDAMK